MIGSRTPFSPRTVVWVISIGIAAGLMMAISSLFIGDGNFTVTAGTNGFSRSALGHRAFIEALKASDRTVVVSQFNSVRKANAADALMLLEPRSADISDKELGRLLEADNVLLVLPKRTGTVDPGNPAWLAYWLMVPQVSVKKILDGAVADAKVVRVSAKDAGKLDWTFKVQPKATPNIKDLQLVQSDRIEPLIKTDKGTLFGLVRIDDDHNLWILSDPDLIETHGLADKTNAGLVGALMNFIAPAGSHVVIDETIHGFKLDPSLAWTMLRPPFLYVSIAVVLAFAAFMVAATRRFGPVRRIEAVIRDGKVAFVSIMASLLTTSGHGGQVVHRYVDRTIREVADIVHAPKGLQGVSLIAWLDDLAARKGLPQNLRARSFTRRMDREKGPRWTEADDLRLALAGDVYRWKQEMIRGGE